MCEVYSKTPPTEPGWYWLRFLGVDESVFELQRDLQSGGCAWRCAAYACNNSHDVMLELGYEFGPRVPSVEELTAIQADQVRLAWLFRTVLQAWPREKIDAQMERDKKAAQISWHPERGWEDDEDFVDPECQ